MARAAMPRPGRRSARAESRRIFCTWRCSTPPRRVGGQGGARPPLAE